MRGTALAAKAKKPPALAQKLHMPVAQRRQSVAVVVARVLGIAYANARRVEQADDHGKHLVARQFPARQIAPETAAKPGQRGGELGHACELGPVTRFAPFRVIAILLASARVATGR